MVELDTEHILYEVEETTAIITLNRPDKQNSLSTEMMYEGAKAIRAADDDEEVRTIIVTGAGDESFCAGADLENRLPTITGDEPYEPSPFFFKNEPIQTPMIAAINGYCIAGGMEFIQFTDIRIAEEGSLFGLREPRWGLIPGGGSTVRLPRQIPYCYAMEYLLTGSLFDAEHAHEAGLINDIVDDGEALATAKDVAESIAKNSPTAINKIKESVHRGLNRGMDDAFRIETELIREMFKTEDAVEGPKAFQEDREPSFRP
jgi:enoyl-CoA hydratase